MGVLLVLLLLYFLWGIPVLLLFNYFFLRTFAPSMGLLESSALTFVVSMVIFMPLTNPAGSFFGDIQMPWWLAICIQPKPYFQILPALIAISSSAISIAFFQWLLRRK